MSVPRLSKAYKPTPCMCGGARKSARDPYCPECAAIYTKPKEKKRKSRLRNALAKYGMDEGDYRSMANKQGDRCAICNRQNISKLQGVRRLVVDHCHETGKVRGLLCAKCNTMLGMAEDNPDWLRAAADYLCSATDFS